MVAFAACDIAPPVASETTGQASSAVWVNGDLETGAAGVAPPSWTLSTYLNPGVTATTPQQTRAGLNLMSGGNPLTVTLVSAGGPESQTDPSLGAGASLRWPKYGNQCAIVNQLGKTQNVNGLAQTMTIAAGDVDPTDGQVHVRFVIAPVLENPLHLVSEQPYYFVQLTNLTRGSILYSDYNASAQPGVPWKQANGFWYTDWQLVDVFPGSGKLALGDQVKLEVIGSGCSLGGHFGQVYLDGAAGATVPGLFVSGTGPSGAPAGTDITYTLNYANGAAAAAAGVKIDFNTPPNTTFVSVSAPALTCVTPTAGLGGLTTCTVGALAAGAGGTFTITVHIAAMAAGTIVAGNYAIYGTGISPLLGPKVITTIGCAADNQCLAGNWCKETAPAFCTPTLGMGVAIPTDASHTAPTLKGTCTATVGSLVCTSGVCDTTDDKCGLTNSTGPCTVAAGANGGVTVCRSGVCDSDLKCGYKDGDGPCTAATASRCRSLACSTNGLCEPSGGCNVDNDCTGGKWCNETTHVCTAKLANGAAAPNDPPHTLPTLDGTCTDLLTAPLVCASSVCDTDNKCGFLNAVGPCAVATPTVCRSGVCDPDLKCGYKNGDGPCTVATAVVCRTGVCDPDLKCGYKDGDGPCTVATASVCRSGACSANGLCEAAGGCNVDQDCVGTWCNETAHTCTAKLGNGAALPTDAPHASPTLDGTCTGPAALLVCVSGVCDADGKCGLSNSDGPCTVANGGVKCRSGVCDADLKCGYKNGDGPCTLGTATAVCRSGSCSSIGVCQAAGACTVDADCSGGNWCSAGTCAPKLPNGAPIPTVAGHAPPITGTCTSAVAAIVCASGVCDTADNKCGFASGDGTCTKTSECRSGDCITLGANSGKCEPCATDATCSGAAPACNTATNQCVSCTSTNGTACTGATPLCDVSTHTCTTSSTCTSDSDCTSDKWCSAGSCVPRVANGTSCDRPTQCASAVCDPDGKCGKQDGEVCGSADVCRSAKCTGGLCGVTEAPGGNADTLGIQGGGCNCTTAPGNGGSNGLAFGGVFFAAALGWRRRRRAVEGSTLVTRATRNG